MEHTKLYSNNDSFQPLKRRWGDSQLTLFWHQFDFIAWSERGNGSEVCAGHKQNDQDTYLQLRLTGSPYCAGCVHSEEVWRHLPLHTQHGVSCCHPHRLHGKYSRLHCECVTSCNSVMVWQHIIIMWLTTSTDCVAIILYQSWTLCDRVCVIHLIVMIYLCDVCCVFVDRVGVIVMIYIYRTNIYICQKVCKQRGQRY